MKKILYILVLLGLASAPLSFAQTHPVKFTVLNTKGKPLSKCLVSMKSYPPTQSVSKQGTITLQTLPPDTVFITAGRLVGRVPIDESVTQITVAVGKGRMSKVEAGKITDVDYPVYSLPSFDSNNLGSMPGIRNFLNLQELVTGKFPEIRIVSDNAYLMTLASAKMGSSPPMLIVIDGSAVSSFTYANEVVRPADLMSINIKKTDPLYGFRGAGGIMEIRLKKGGDK